MQGKKTGGRQKGTTNKCSVFHQYNDEVISYFQEGYSINKTLKKINEDYGLKLSIGGFHSYIKKMQLDGYLIKKRPNVVTKYKKRQSIEDYRIDLRIYTIYFSYHKIRFPSGLYFVYRDNRGLECMKEILLNYEKSFSEDEVYECIYEPIIELINEIDHTHIDKQFEDYNKNLEYENHVYNYTSKQIHQKKKKNISDLF